MNTVRLVLGVDMKPLPLYLVGEVITIIYSFKFIQFIEEDICEHLFLTFAV